MRVASSLGPRRSRSPARRAGRFTACAVALFAGTARAGATAPIPPRVDPAAPDTVPHAFAGPLVRVAVAVERPALNLSSDGGLRLEESQGARVLAAVESAERLRARVERGAISVEGVGKRIAGTASVLVVRPLDPRAPVRVDGRSYRGTVEVRAAGDRLTAINVLPLEDYLLGVVPLEIGARAPEELAAVEAQAVAARTYAVARLGARAELGFDLFGTVEDQAYGGLAAERKQSSRAVRRTAGRILMYDGRPIRAYYHSTCGGRTAAIEEVLDREPAPYLESVSDRRPDGSAYCADSPRFEWEVAWPPEALDSVTHEGLTARFGSDVGRDPGIRELRVVRRTRTGRVLDLALQGEGAQYVLSRLDIRRALSTRGRILNSTAFEITDGEDGLVKVRGRGYGHGAGMCQWGAIGRARDGQSVEQILATYYPGAELVNVYGGEGG